jgi:hypothetical protein
MSSLCHAEISAFASLVRKWRVYCFLIPYRWTAHSTKKSLNWIFCGISSASINPGWKRNLIDMPQKSSLSISRVCMAKLRRLPLPQSVRDDRRRKTLSETLQIQPILPAAYRLRRPHCIQFVKASNRPIMCMYVIRNFLSWRKCLLR